MLNVNLPTLGIGPDDLGSTGVVNQLSTMLGSNLDRFGWRGMVTSLPGTQWLGAATSVQLATGITSWGEAYETLDPTDDWVIRDGLNALGSMLPSVYRYMIQQNLGQATFFVAKEVFGGQQPPGITGTQKAIIMAITVSILGFNGS